MSRSVLTAFIAVFFLAGTGAGVWSVLSAAHLASQNTHPADILGNAPAPHARLQR